MYRAEESSLVKEGMLRPPAVTRLCFIAARLALTNRRRVSYESSTIRLATRRSDLRNNLVSTQTQTDEQAGKSPTTKIGSFLAKKGRVVVKDFYTVGTVYGRYGTSVEISGLVIYEPGQEAQRIRGLRYR